MSIRQVLEGIEARLLTVGLRATAHVADNVSPPAAVVGVPDVESYEEAYGRGKYNLAPTITVLTSAALDRTGQLALADYASLTGPLSVFAAIEADRTLGGAAEDTRVESFRPLGLDEVGRIGYYGGIFTVTVLTKEAP